MTMSVDGLDRARDLMTLIRGDEKHRTAALSTLDALWVLYDRVLEPASKEVLGDRFYLSKGHGPIAYYAVLVARGLLELADLLQFGDFHGRLGHHPDRVTAPAVEISSGSLGHGPGLAVGTALAQRACGSACARIFVLIGDGELDEGSVWEAITFAGRERLTAIHLVVVDNESASLGWPGGIASRLAAEGWQAEQVAASDHDALARSLADCDPARPRAVVVKAIAGTPPMKES